MKSCFRALFSRDIRLPLDTSNQSAVEENFFFGHHFSTFDSLRDFPQWISSENVHRNREAVPLNLELSGESKSDKWRRTKSWRSSNADICFDYEFYNTWELPQNYVVGQQTQQMSELQIDNFPTPASFLVWKTRSKTQVSNGSDFSIGSNVMDQRSGGGWFSGRTEIFTIGNWKEFSKKLRCWTRRVPRLWTRSSRIPSSKRWSASRNRKPKKKKPVSVRETDRLHDQWLLSSGCCSWHSIRFYWFTLLLSVMTTFRNSTRDGTKFCHRCQKFHPMISWKVCTNWGYVGLINSKPFLELYYMEIHHKIPVPNHQKFENHGGEEKRSETSFTKLWRQTWENWICSRCKESKVIVMRWMRKWYLSPVEKASVRKETDAVSATKPKLVHKNQNTLPPHFSSQPCHEAEVRQRREASEAKRTVDPFFDKRVDIFWRVPSR